MPLFIVIPVENDQLCSMNLLKCPLLRFPQSHSCPQSLCVALCGLIRPKGAPARCLKEEEEAAAGKFIRGIQLKQNPHSCLFSFS